MSPAHLGLPAFSADEPSGGRGLGGGVFHMGIPLQAAKEITPGDLSSTCQSDVPRLPEHRHRPCPYLCLPSQPPYSSSPTPTPA